MDMMTEKHKPIACPDCGAPMNHHADKLVYSVEVSQMGMLMEFHHCPGCGTGVARPGTLEPAM